MGVKDAAKREVYKISFLGNGNKDLQVVYLSENMGIADKERITGDINVDTIKGLEVLSGIKDELNKRPVDNPKQSGGIIIDLNKDGKICGFSSRDKSVITVFNDPGIADLILTSDIKLREKTASEEELQEASLSR